MEQHGNFDPEMRKDRERLEQEARDVAKDPWLVLGKSQGPAPEQAAASGVEKAYRLMQVPGEERVKAAQELLEQAYRADPEAAARAQQAHTKGEEEAAA